MAANKPARRGSPRKAIGGGAARRVLLWIAPLLFLGGLGYAGYRYLDAPGRLPLRVVSITGGFTYLDQAQIRKRMAGAIEGGFLGVDMEKVRAAVLALPWAAEVSVRRVWPDTLRLHVVEQVPLGYWNQSALVNLQGRVFRPARLPQFEGLPRLRGEDDKAPEVAAFYLQLQTGELPDGLRVAEVDLNRRGEWRVVFDDGLALMLGQNDEGLPRRLKHFVRTYPLLARRQGRLPRRIDMRYEHGFAVEWRPVDDETQAATAVARTGDS